MGLTGIIYDWVLSIVRLFNGTKAHSKLLKSRKKKSAIEISKHFDFPLEWLSLEENYDNNIPFAQLPSSYFPKRNINVPKHRKTIVLDLDETLIHSTTRSSRYFDTMIEVFLDRHPCLYYVFKRPHTDFFLKTISEWFDVVVYTASRPEYANPILNWLETSKKIFKERYFRDVVFSKFSHVCCITVF